MLAALTLAVIAPTLATAAGTTKCHIAFTSLTAPVKVSGKLPLTGSSVTTAGTIDGKLCGRAFHGAMRLAGTFTAPGKSTAAGRIFGPLGSIRVTGNTVGTHHPDGSGSLNGSAKITGGTGPYKGARGSFSITGTSPAGSNVNTIQITGTIMF
jgi:hypothetical protein